MLRLVGEGGGGVGWGAPGRAGVLEDWVGVLEDVWLVFGLRGFRILLHILQGLRYLIKQPVRSHDHWVLDRADEVLQLGQLGVGKGRSMC